MARAAVIVIGGAPPPHGVVARLPADRYVIAADSGLDHALALGLSVDALIGDLDSVSDAGRRHAEHSGMAIHHYPPDKDATDTELAIELAISVGCDPVIGVTGGGERLDHALGALLAFASPELARVRVEVHWEAQHVAVVHGPGGQRLVIERIGEDGRRHLDRTSVNGDQRHDRPVCNRAELEPAGTVHHGNVLRVPVDLDADPRVIW